MAMTQSGPAAVPSGTPLPTPVDRPSRWFWPNLVLLAVLAPFATYWFKQHLELYLTEVVLIGGGISLWAAGRIAFGLAEKLGKLDPLAQSRRALGSPEATLLLSVATIAFIALWWTTTSFYLQYEGGAAGDREFVVRVSRVADRTPFMPDMTVGPATKVAGQAFLFRGQQANLECKIVKPLLYEPLPCSIDLREAKRIRVPAGFKGRSFHLLRIVPTPALYDELPESDDRPEVSYRLEISADGKALAPAIVDLRRQTIYAGGSGPDMPLVLGLQDRQDYEQYLGSALRAMSVESNSATRMAAVLVLRTKPFDAVDAKAGQRLRFSLKRSVKRDGKESSSEVDGFPAEYVVTDEKVQTIWLPKLP